MTAEWGTAADPEAATTDYFNVSGPRLIKGVNSAASNYYSATDPSASASWGANQKGRIWIDVGVDGSVTNPVYKQWDDLTGASSYGWRKMRLRHVNMTLTPVDITSLLSSPYTTDDLTGVSIDLSTNLNTLQDNNSKLVTEVDLYTEISDSGSAFGTKQPFIGLRPAGAASFTHKKLWCQVTSLRVSCNWIIRFGTSTNVEKLEFIRQVAQTSGNLTVHRFEIMGYTEAF